MQRCCVAYITGAAGRPTDIGLQLGKVCYPCSRWNVFISSVSSLSFLFLFLPCTSLPSPLLSILSLFSLFLGDDTKWPTRVDVSLNPNSINQSISVKLNRNVTLVTLYQDCSSCHDSSKNMATRGPGLFSLYIYIENFKTLLVKNQWTDFNITWLESFFGDPLLGLFKQSWFVKKHGCQGLGLIFPIYLYRTL